MGFKSCTCVNFLLLLYFDPLYAWEPFTSCLPSAVTPRDSSIDGDAGPLRTFLLPWASSEVSTRILTILSTEVVGVRIDDWSIGAQGSSEPPKGIGGCPPDVESEQTPLSLTFSNCDLTQDWSERTPVGHIMIEGWGTAARSLQAFPPSLVPDMVRALDYQGVESVYVPGKYLNQSKVELGLDVRSYKSWDLDWVDHSSSFSTFEEIVAEAGKGDSFEDGVLNAGPGVMTDYVTITGDEEGVGQDGAALLDADGVWRPPLCREDRSKCVPLIAPASGWGLVEQFQRTTALGLPFASMVYPWDEANELVRKFDVVFTWWYPDTTYVDLKAEYIAYPAHDAAQHQEGNYTTANEAFDLLVVAHKKLKDIEPDVYSLLVNFGIGVPEMNLLMEWIGGGMTPEEAACRWVQENEATWREWLPAECGRGKGYDAEGNCEFCTDGTNSELVEEGGEHIRRCVPCPVGHYCGFATIEPLPCPSGAFCPEGSSTPTDCPQGTFQDMRKRGECQTCPFAFMTTMVEGSKTPLDCVCALGFYHRCDNGDLRCEKSLEELGAFSDEFCSSCPAGLTCEGGFREYGGKIIHSEPAVAPGFQVFPESPFEVYLCREKNRCPGGRIGEKGEEGVGCLPHGRGISCSECEEGFSLVGDECLPCPDAKPGVLEAGVTVGGFVALVLGMASVYKFANAKLRSEASTLLLASNAFGILLMACQAVAVVGEINIPWPTVNTVSISLFSVTTLNLEVARPGCYLGQRPLGLFLVKVLMPILIILLYALFCWTQRAQSRQQFRRCVNRCINCVGHITQALYITLVLASLMPLQCFSHPAPNTRKSLVSYPFIVCGEPEHQTMVVLSAVSFCIYAVGFFVFCVYVCIVAPQKSIESSLVLIRCRFLFYRFRPDRWWWGCVYLLRSALIALAPIVNTEDPYYQITHLAVVLAASLFLQCIFWPWKAKMLNAADAFVNLGLLLLITGGASFLDKSEFFETYSVAGLVLAVLILIPPLFCNLLGIFLTRTFGKSTPLCNLEELKGLLHSWNYLTEQMSSASKAAEDYLMGELNQFDTYIIWKCGYFLGEAERVGRWMERKKWKNTDVKLEHGEHAELHRRVKIGGEADAVVDELSNFSKSNSPASLDSTPQCNRESFRHFVQVPLVEDLDEAEKINALEHKNPSVGLENRVEGMKKVFKSLARHTAPRVVQGGGFHASRRSRSTGSRPSLPSQALEAHRLRYLSGDVDDKEEEPEEVVEEAAGRTARARAYFENLLPEEGEKASSR